MTMTSVEKLEVFALKQIEKDAWNSRIRAPGTICNHLAIRRDQVPPALVTSGATAATAAFSPGAGFVDREGAAARVLTV